MMSSSRYDVEDGIVLSPITKPIQTLKISNCKSLNDVINYINSPAFAYETKSSNDIFFAKFRIAEYFEGPTETEVNQLVEKCKNLSIIIFLSSRSILNLSILWKSMEIDFFLVLKSYAETFVAVDKKVYLVAAEMIADSLSNGHLGISNSKSFCKSQNNVEIFELNDKRCFNLLLFASELGFVDVISCLCKLGLDGKSVHENITCQELALKNSHYDVIIALYKENFTFPKLFDINKCSNDFIVLFEKINQLYNFIEDDNLDQVQEIFQHLPRTNYCYNLENDSALKLATKNKSFKCYDFFLRENLRFAPHELPEQYYKDLELDDQREIREIHQEHAQELPERHINVLLSNSFISHDVADSEDKLKFIRRAYEVLSANFLIKIVLLVVAASNDFKIIFDFNRDGVNVADPTKTSETIGIFYYFGRIYIGAKQLLDENTSHEIYGTIAHELCHFAMNLVYRNKTKPYKSDDTKCLEEFTEITAKCEKQKDHEELISSVFDDYPESNHHSELIVRIVHFLAMYRNQPEKLEEARKFFGCLFDFYEHKVVPEMNEALPEIQGRAEKEIEEKIKEKDKKISMFKKLSLLTVVLSVILIIFGVIITRSIFYKPDYKFSELSNEYKVKIEIAPIIYKNIQIKFEELFPVNSSVYYNLTSDHISQMFDGDPLNFNDLHLTYLNDQVRLSWEFLTAKLRDKLLKSKLNFQNQSVSFEELHEKVPNAFEFLTSKQIIDVLDGKELTVDKMIYKRVNFYFKRSFLEEDILVAYLIYRNQIENYSYDSNFRNEFYKSEEKFQIYYNQLLSQNLSIYRQQILDAKRNLDFEYSYKNNFFYTFNYLIKFKSFHENFSKILNKTENSKFVILSSEAGTGKTTTFEDFTFRIKQKFPTRWVSYIDLKDFTRFYAKNGSLDVLKLLNNILDLNSKSEFERKIFEELYASGEVVLLWNGFDEISPTYSDFVFEVLDIIHKNTKNIQFVCTRSLYMNVFNSQIDTIRLTLVPFDRENQQKFLNETFTNFPISSKNIQTYIDKVFKITNSLQDNKFETEDFNTPLMGNRTTAPNQLPHDQLPYG